MRHHQQRWREHPNHLRSRREEKVASTKYGQYICATINNAGVDTRTISDLAGRTVRTIQNFDGLPYGATGSGFYTDGSLKPITANMSQDVTTDCQYDDDGRLIATVAYDANSSNPIVAETTKYLYNSTIDASLQTGQISPDSTDTVTRASGGDWADSGTDHTSTTYNLEGRQGHTLTFNFR
jgi:hypothetical protein